MRVIGKGNVLPRTEVNPEPPALTGNAALFEQALRAKYVRLFMDDPEYAYSAAHTTPENLADIMTRGLLAGSANKDGKGIRGVCRDFGIKHTYKALSEFLKA